MALPTMIQNPILPGFAPDPSLVRVGADYYLATSTFEWWPGIEIYHSRGRRTSRIRTGCSGWSTPM